MSNTKQDTKTVIDLDGAILQLKRRGTKTNKAEVISSLLEIGFKVSMPTVMLWNVEAPPIVSLMNYCLKNSKKTFPDIMQKLRGRDKALDFVLHFCNQTGLTFDEIVKEI